MTKIHDSATCTAGFNSRPCDMCQFAQNASQANSGLSEADQGKKIDSSGLSASGMAICRDCQGSGAGDGLAGVCPYCHGLGQVEAYEARQQRLATSVTVPTFEQEWHDAPRWVTNYTEQQVAEWWFIRGQHAKEVELLAGMNVDLREMIRVARERVEG